MCALDLDRAHPEESECPRGRRVPHQGAEPPMATRPATSADRRSGASRTAGMISGAPLCGRRTVLARRRWAGEQDEELRAGPSDVACANGQHHIARPDRLPEGARQRRPVAPPGDGPAAVGDRASNEIRA